MPDTKYCYPDTDILINKLDIRDLDKLHIFERKLTMLRLLELLDKPINGKLCAQTRASSLAGGMPVW